MIAVSFALLTAACFQGAEREKAPPPGYAGGFCLAPTTAVPQPHCVDGSLCDLDGAFCFDPMDPCEGFFCGGEERGVCSPDASGLPACTCKPGYTNEMWPMYCCPDPAVNPEFDELCASQAFFGEDTDGDLAWTPFEVE